MAILANAIKDRNWELAALCLLIGMARALSHLPADSVEGVLDVLEDACDETAR
jgi:hypothetical protein